MTADINGCVVLCAAGTGGDASMPSPNGLNGWAPYPDGNGSDDARAHHFLTGQVTSVWIGISMMGSGFVEPGSNVPVPSGFWAAGEPGSGGCVAVTGSGWISDDCSHTRPYLLDIPPKM
jgi:hypothetical protein